MAESMGRGKIDGALRRGQGTFNGIGQGIVAVRVLDDIHHGQDRPTVCLVRGFAHDAFENPPHHGVFLGSEAREVVEGAKHGLVWSQAVFTFGAQRFAHASGQDAVLIGDS